MLKPHLELVIAAMSRAIKLVGLDCGSTTTSVVVAAARLTADAMGRVEITDLEPVFRSPVVFTPLAENKIDARRLECLLDEWLAAAATRDDEIFGGGALITGLAAQRENASAIAALIESRLADSVIAAADDPRLESWLAFMGNCHALSKAHPTTSLLNLDIGGGTTNLALGRDGQVTATGCLFVGARHFQFVPGTYELTGVSPCAAALLDHLEIDRRAGDALAEGEIDAILDFYVGLIEATVERNTQPIASDIIRRHIQAPLAPAGAIEADTAITLSGGVGQMVYDRLRGQAASGATQYGDLGGELAARLVRSPAIASRLGRLAPEGLGRATVFGLMRHSMELSGSTIFLPHPERLPLKNVPIIGQIGPQTSDEHLAGLLDLAARAAPGACLRVDLPQPSLDALRQLGDRLANLLAARPLGPDRTLVLLVPANVGKVLGHYATRWGTLAVNLIAVDEVPLREGQFVRLGKMREGVVPLWLHTV